MVVLSSLQRTGPRVWCNEWVCSTVSNHQPNRHSFCSSFAVNNGGERCSSSLMIRQWCLLEPQVENSCHLIWFTLARVQKVCQRIPSDWHVATTLTHSSNEETMKVYIDKIIVPYVELKWKELQLPSTFPALMLFDHFSGQTSQVIFDLIWSWKNTTSCMCLFPKHAPIDFSRWTCLLINPSKVIFKAHFRHGMHLRLRTRCKNLQVQVSLP